MARYRGDKVIVFSDNIYALKVRSLPQYRLPPPVPSRPVLSSCCLHPFTSLGVRPSRTHLSVRMCRLTPPPPLHPTPPHPTPQEDAVCMRRSLVYRATPTLLPSIPTPSPSPSPHHPTPVGVCRAHAAPLHLRRHRAPGAHARAACLQAQSPGQHRVPIQGGSMLQGYVGVAGLNRVTRAKRPPLVTTLTCCLSSLPQNARLHPRPRLTTNSRWATTLWTSPRPTCWSRSPVMRGRGDRRRSA